MYAKMIKIIRNSKKKNPFYVVIDLHREKCEK